MATRKKETTKSEVGFRWVSGDLVRKNQETWVIFFISMNLMLFFCVDVLAGDIFILIGESCHED